jgi:hypothetical protein
MSEEELMRIDDYDEMFQYQKEYTLRTCGVEGILSPMSKFSTMLRISGGNGIPEGAIKKSVASLFRDVAFSGHKPYSDVVVTDVSDTEFTRDILFSVNTIKDL